MIKFGIIGAGNIANTFADALNGIGGEAYAIASRSLEKATDFKNRHGFEVAYGTYEAMLADPMVDCVYIATPHALHYEHMMLALEYDKHVLCEKPFTINTAQAKRVFAFAKQKQRFVMEAMWTRFLPAMQETIALVRSGIIGEINTLTCDFCFDLGEKNLKNRMFNMDMGAGALLDIGVYNINFAYLFLGLPEQITSNVVLHPNGMDQTDDITFHYKKAKAHLYISLVETKPQDGYIHGTNGMIKVHDFFRTQQVDIYNKKGEITQTIEHPHRINGFEYEIIEVINQITNGKLESDIMSHDETLKILKLMDQLRSDWQLKYPGE